MDGFGDILNSTDQDFDEAIHRMDIQELVTTISSLQSAMSEEQMRFNELSFRMNNIGQREKDSDLYDRLTSDLMTSQLRLGVLMNRNVKCFQQQTANENQDLMTKLIRDIGMSAPNHDNNNMSPPMEQDDTDSGVDADFISAGSTQAQANKDILNYMPSGTLGQLPLYSGRQVDGMRKQPINFDDLVQGLKESSVDDDEKSPNPALDETVNGIKDLQITHRVQRNTASSSHVGGNEHEEYALEQGVRERAALFSKLDKSQDIIVKPKNKTGEVLGTIKQSSVETADAQLQYPKKTKRVQFAPDTEFYERENPKPKISLLDLQDQFPAHQSEGEPDSVEVEGEADEDGLIIEGEGDEAGMEDEWVDVGTYQGIPSGNNPDNTAIMFANKPDEATPHSSKTTVNRVSTSFNVKLEHGTNQGFNQPKIIVKKNVNHEENRQRIMKENEDTVKDNTETVKENLHKPKRIVTGSIANRVSAYLKNAHSNDGATENGEANVKPLSIRPQKRVVHIGTTKSQTDKDSTRNTNSLRKEVSVNSAVVTLLDDKVEKAVNDSGVVEVEDRPAQPRVEEVWDEPVAQRSTLTNWNPDKILDELYTIDYHPQKSNLVEFPSIEGYLEKLPLNKKKDTVLKTWKKRYFRVQNGCVQYEENDLGEASTVTLQMQGGCVDHLDSTMIGIDDGKGRYLVVRCPTENDAIEWKSIIEAQTIDDVDSKYIHPVQGVPLHPHRKVIVVDLGSCSVRAGLLREQPSLPDLFFPCVIAVDKERGTKVIGRDAYNPEVRATSSLVFPIRPSTKVDKYAVDIGAIPLIFKKILTDLKIKNPGNYWIMISSPGNMSNQLKEEIVNILINDMKVGGVHMIDQTVLTLYAYGATSGIVVNVGDRLEIIPVTDGYVMDAGVTRQAYGGHKVGEMLNQGLMLKSYRFFTDVEWLLVRYTLEKSCYISSNFYSNTIKCKSNPGQYRKSLDLASLDLPPGTWEHVTHDSSRFTCGEGLFDMELWEMDNPPIHKLVQRAIQACPMDHRKEMCRSIYLSGGATLMPGFQDRLQAELEKLLPNTIAVQVHGSSHRYHAAYVGACKLASMPQFEQAGISSKQWKRDGPACLEKYISY